MRYLIFLSILFMIFSCNKSDKELIQEKIKSVRHLSDHYVDFEGAHIPVSTPYLNYPSIGLKKIDTIKGLTNTISLDVKGNPISKIRPLAFLVELRYLSIGRSYIISLEPLKKLKYLKKLSISFTYVSDISPLKNLPLELLDMYRTDVKDLSSLPATLKRLYIDKKVGMNEIARFKKKHPKCKIFFKPFEYTLQARRLPRKKPQ